MDDDLKATCIKYALDNALPEPCYVLGYWKSLDGEVIEVFFLYFNDYLYKTDWYGKVNKDNLGNLLFSNKAEAQRKIAEYKRERPSIVNDYLISYEIMDLMEPKESILIKRAIKLFS